MERIKLTQNLEAMQVVKFIPTDKNYNRNHRKENWPHTEWSLIDAEKLSNKLILRIYHNQKASTIYAACWINFMSASGTGSANGYGYHKASAAAAEALRNCGITLNEPIDGRGESMIIEAIEAFANYLHLTKFYIHKSNA